MKQKKKMTSSGFLLLITIVLFFVMYAAGMVIFADKGLSLIHILFSQNMGQTFIEYLTALRMEHARELLRCTGKRSSEIAAEVGYKDAHYFSYLFKKTQGMTPSEYRKTREDRG